MKILSIESATSVCGAAVIENSRVRSERILDMPHIHSEKMVTLIDESLDDASCDFEELDGIAVSIGPGSFTGLRIGLSVAKGLAYARSKSLVTVPTLEALALNAVRQQLVNSGALVVPLIDARRNEVYIASYRLTGGEIEESVPARSVTLEELQFLLRDENCVVIVGDGAEKFQHHLMKVQAEDAVRFLFPPRNRCLCRPSAVGILGEQKLSRGEIAELSSLEPRYVKDFYTLVKTQHAQV